MEQSQQSPHVVTAPLLASLHGLAALWDRRAAEVAESAAAEAYQRAAAEAQEVLRVLAPPHPAPPARRDPAVQADLGL
jgi:hypothetical protein